MKRKLSLLAILIFLFDCAFSQSGITCETASRLCNLDSFTQDTIAPGGSNFTPDCFGGISPGAGHWYQFTVAVTGQSVWQCTPTIQATVHSTQLVPGNGIELDWAMYDISNGCPTTGNQTLGEIACNYNFEGENSYPIGMATSVNNCANGTGPQNDSASGEFCPPATLLAGHSYAIFINNYSYNPATDSGRTGWNMNFTGSTFQIAPVTGFSITPDTICASSGTVTITNTNPDAGQIWNFGDGSVDTTASPGTHFYSQPGSYIISVIDSAFGCRVSGNRVVDIDTGDRVTLQAQQTCPGIAATLSAPHLAGGSYLWNTGATTQNITVTPTTDSLYTVYCTASNGCRTIASDSVILTNSPVADISGGDYTCAGTPSTLTASNGISYSWANGLGSGQSITVSPANTSTYTVTVTLGVNCSASASQTLNVNQPSSSQLSQTICQGSNYNFNNQLLTLAGNYHDTLQNSVGCDSIVTLHLSIDSIVPVVTRSGDVLATQSFGSYQWELNGSYLVAANSQYFTMTQNGNYTVLITDSNGCAHTSAALNVIDLGIDDPGSAFGVKLYPNPNTGNFTIEFTDDTEKEIEITDEVGRIILREAKVSKQKYFNLDQLSNGIYFLRIGQNSPGKSLKFSVIR